MVLNVVPRSLVIFIAAADSEVASARCTCVVYMCCYCTEGNHCQSAFWSLRLSTVFFLYLLVEDQANSNKGGGGCKVAPTSGLL